MWDTPDRRSCKTCYLFRIGSANWPIVPIVKNDKSIRLCGDYELTVNGARDTESYLPPRMEIIATSSGTTFSKLDLLHAYQQLILNKYFQSSWLLIFIQVCFIRHGISTTDISTNHGVFLQGLSSVCLHI